MSGKIARKERKSRRQLERLLLESEKQKEKLLQDSLDRHGIKIDKEVEAKRTFKTLVIERDDKNHKEYIIYNDGSIKGKLLLVIETIVNKKKDSEDFTVELKPYCTSVVKEETNENGEENAKK